MPVPFASLSTHSLVSSAATDVAFAAILGIAILVLLFFSQARETANLRRRADDAESELDELRAYVDRLARQRAAVPAPAAAPTPAPAAARARVAAPPAAALAGAAVRVLTGSTAPATGSIPFAPAGTGAPALSSATRLIPLAEAEPISIRAVGHAATTEPTAAGNGARVGEEALVGVAAGAAARSGIASAQTALPVAPSAALAEPQTFASPPAQADPEPSHDESPRPSTHAAGAVAGAQPNPRSVPPPASARRPSGSPNGRSASSGRGAASPPPRRAGSADPRRGGGRIAVVAVAAVVVAAIAVGVVELTGSGGGSHAHGATAASHRGASQRDGSSAAAPSGPVVPADVTVTVLNGTSTSHLAADVLNKLTALGFKQGGQPNNASDQTLTSTIVGYTSPAYRRDALAVAKSMNLGQANVQGVSQGDRAIACPHGPCSVQVVVTAGSDQASAATG
ncbi:MAG: LytR C-terminal domain-containing protein [Solirubrobacteraceae bacterium]